MPSDWPDPVEIGDSSASHAALSWPALRFAPVNAEVRFLGLNVLSANPCAAQNLPRV